LTVPSHYRPFLGLQNTCFPRLFFSRLPASARHPCFSFPRSSLDPFCPPGERAPMSFSRPIFPEATWPVGVELCCSSPPCSPGLLFLISLGPSILLPCVRASPSNRPTYSKNTFAFRGAYPLLSPAANALFFPPYCTRFFRLKVWAGVSCTLSLGTHSYLHAAFFYDHDGTVLFSTCKRRAHSIRRWVLRSFPLLLPS